MDDDQQMPAMWNYVEKVYFAMQESATPESGTLVWEGHTTKLFSELAVPTPYYTAVLRLLKDMGCIHQMRRGGGGSTSQWALWEDPTPEVFLQVHNQGKEKRASVAPRDDVHRRVDVLEQQVADIRGLLGGVNVPQAISDIMKEVREQAIEKSA